MKNSIAKLILWLIVISMVFSFQLVAYADGNEPDPWAVAIDPNLNYLLIVNEEHPYDFTSAYDIFLQKDLIYVSDVYGYATPIEHAAYLAFSQLQVALKEKGMTIGLYSAYRTKEDQQAVYDYYANLPGWSESNKVLKPGYSEHHTGLVIDVFLIDNGKEIRDNDDLYAAEELFAKIHPHLADHGFILRYPKGKEEITGYDYEPWHFRYVGTEIAKKITDQGATLEEYLGETK
jgi:D-alanyl-D-alanine carboxypeptidase